LLLDDFSQGLKGWDNEVEASPYSYISGFSVRVGLKVRIGALM
jgi:hypothetical protein